VLVYLTIIFLKNNSCNIKPLEKTQLEKYAVITKMFVRKYLKADDMI